jgi:hypothetical protein
MGPFGSGKSTACIMDILKHAQLQKIAKDGKAEISMGGCSKHIS